MALEIMLVGLELKLYECQQCLLSTNTRPAVPWLLLNKPARIMFIGEAPGTTESNCGRPFSGAAGQILQDLLVDINFPLDIYITNVVKHQPPNNRKPQLDEMLICGNEFLLKEIEMVKPKLIICLGRTSAEFLLSIKQEAHTGTLRGQKFFFDDVPVLCTWHPSFYLHTRDEGILADIKSDLIKAKDYLSNLELRSTNYSIER